MIPTLLALSALTIPYPIGGSTVPLSVNGIIRIAAVQSEVRAAGVPAEYVSSLFNDPRVVIAPPPVISTSTTPIPGIDWALVEKNTLDPVSVQQGHEFIAANKAALQKAEAKYGVSPYSLATVIRIETNFGAITGRRPVFNYFLSSMVNASDDSSVWQKQNLASLIKYCYLHRNTGNSETDCLGLKGSTSGAFGLSQFLPYSVEQWGVDGNNDGKIDLFDPEDVISSTANFLKAHGWGKTTASRLKALGQYYGSPAHYPAIAMKYGETLKKQNAALASATR